MSICVDGQSAQTLEVQSIDPFDIIKWIASIDVTFVENVLYLRCTVKVEAVCVCKLPPWNKSYFDCRRCRRDWANGKEVPSVICKLSQHFINKYALIITNRSFQCLILEINSSVEQLPTTSSPVRLGYQELCTLLPRILWIQRFPNSKVWLIMGQI